MCQQFILDMKIKTSNYGRIIHWYLVLFLLLIPKHRLVGWALRVQMYYAPLLTPQGLCQL